jgi:protein Mpv17
MKTTAGMIGFEVFGANPFLAMPSYYACKGFFEGSGVMEGLMQYKKEFNQVFVEYAMCWVPAHAVTFGIMPPQFRVAWVGFVSLGYLSRLSFVSHKEELPAAQRSQASYE